MSLIFQKSKSPVKYKVSFVQLSLVAKLATAPFYLLILSMMALSFILGIPIFLIALLDGAVKKVQEK